MTSDDSNLDALASALGVLKKAQEDTWVWVIERTEMGVWERLCAPEKVER